jgi:hypothetical protein
LERIRHAERGVLAPKFHQELLARDYLIHVQQQADKHGALTNSLYRDASATFL